MKSTRMKGKMVRTAFLVLAVACCLCGCAGNEGITVLRTWEVERTGTPDSRMVFRVGMVTDVQGVHDDSFNWSAWEGLQELSKATDCNVSYMEPGPEGDYARCFRMMAEEGFDLIWGIGFSCAEDLLDAAEQYPGTRFAIVDEAIPQPPDNVACAVFQAEDASFLVGYIAASVTKSGKVGFVGGVASEPIDQFQYGFQAGAAWADRERGRETAVLAEYADSFADAAGGREIALSMIDQGCDIVYHAAGGTGLGVIQAAAERGAYAIGADRDQSGLAPKNVLTSALKDVGAVVRQISTDWLAGGSLGGSTFRFGLREGAVGIPKGHENYSDELYDAAMRLADRIVSGEIAPPVDAESYARFLESMVERIPVNR